VNAILRPGSLIRTVASPLPPNLLTTDGPWRDLFCFPLISSLHNNTRVTLSGTTSTLYYRALLGLIHSLLERYLSLYPV